MKSYSVIFHSNSNITGLWDDVSVCWHYPCLTQPYKGNLGNLCRRVAFSYIYPPCHNWRLPHLELSFIGSFECLSWVLLSDSGCTVREIFNCMYVDCSGRFTYTLVFVELHKVHHLNWNNMQLKLSGRKFVWQWLFCSLGVYCILCTFSWTVMTWSWHISSQVRVGQFGQDLAGWSTLLDYVNYWYLYVCL